MHRALRQYWALNRLQLGCNIFEGNGFRFCHFLPQNTIDSGPVISFPHITHSGRVCLSTTNLYIIWFFVTSVQNQKATVLYFFGHVCYYCFSHWMPRLLKCISMKIIFSLFSYFARNHKKYYDVPRNMSQHNVCGCWEPLPLLLCIYYLLSVASADGYWMLPSIRGTHTHTHTHTFNN